MGVAYTAGVATGWFPQTPAVVLVITPPRRTRRMCTSASSVRRQSPIGLRPFRSSPCGSHRSVRARSSAASGRPRGARQLRSCRASKGISRTTLLKCRRKYGGARVADVKPLRDLEAGRITSERVASALRTSSIRHGSGTRRMLRQSRDRGMPNRGSARPASCRTFEGSRDRKR